MKILFDINVILDVLLNRHPFVETATNLVALVESKQIEGYLCANTITTLDYLLSKAMDKNQAKLTIRKLLILFEICDVNRLVIEQSLNSAFKNFEDAVQHYSGKCHGIDGLVTRNIKDFKQAELPIYTPEELWSIVNINGLCSNWVTTRAM